MSDYYEFMGIERTATPEQVRAAFRRLSFEFHPDRNPGNHDAAEICQMINEAYEILSDPEARRAYDAALVGEFPEGAPQGGVTVHEVLEGLGAMTGLFMEAMARSKKPTTPVPKGACPVCRGKGMITLELGPLALEKGCETCQGSGRQAKPKDQRVSLS